MRIIAGEHRGRRLVAPAGEGTRPMQDRVREALFAKLGERVEGARVLDLFAGSGSLGLEALSRGARSVRAVERDPAALAALGRNAAALGVLERIEVRRDDALSPRVLAPPAEVRESAWIDLALLDPPYPLLRMERPRVLAWARRVLSVLAPGGVLVLHAPRSVLTARDFGAGVAVEERAYGTTALWYVEPAPAEEEPS